LTAVLYHAFATAGRAIHQFTFCRHNSTLFAVIVSYDETKSSRRNFTWLPCVNWCRGPESNWGHADFQPVAGLRMRAHPCSLTATGTGFLARAAHRRAPERGGAVPSGFQAGHREKIAAGPSPMRMSTVAASPRVTSFTFAGRL